MKDRVFFAFPTVPADVSATGAAEYSGLLQRNKLSSTHAAAQASAIAAAKILVYALERCGKGSHSRAARSPSLKGFMNLIRD